MMVPRKPLTFLACIFTVMTLVANIVPFNGPSSVYAGNKKVQLNVKGMEGYASITEVKKALSEVKGVKKVYVDFRNERAIVTVKKGTDLDTLVSAVKKAGFKAYLAEKVGVNEKKAKELDPYKDFDKDEPIRPTR